MLGKPSWRILWFCVEQTPEDRIGLEFAACDRAGLIRKFDTWWKGFYITADQVEAALLKLEQRIKELEQAPKEYGNYLKVGLPE